MIKAIDTVYKGYKFRSRLEARWAVFFDTLGLKWDYEREGFDIDGKWYLPDFYLPHLKLWVEIKPGDPESWPEHIVFDYFKKHNVHQFESGEDFIILVGNPWFDGEYFDYSGYMHNDNDYRWCECSKCGLIGIEYDGRSYRLPCNCFSGDQDGKGYNTGSLRLMTAYRAARQARFEHNDILREV